MLLLILVGVLGAGIGSILTMVYLYWQLATGRRTVRPWSQL